MTSETVGPAGSLRQGPPVRLNEPLPVRGRRRSGESFLTHHVRKTMARGFRPPPSWSVPVRYVLPDGTTVASGARAAAHALRNRATPALALVAPTVVSRGTLTEQEERLDALLDRVAETGETHPHAPLVLFVGMQWSSAPEEAESVRRLGALLRRAADRLPALGVCGLSLPGPGKPRTLNAAIEVAELLGCAGVGWVDDDVSLDPGCLARLVGDFLTAGCRGASGATKIPHTKEFATSRLLARAKAIAAPATNYPHGCCILVATDVLSGGMPGRYVSDDGYICFRLLDPALPDPLARLRLVPDAHCHYYVAGPAGETRRRIRRLLLNHLVDLADWPLPAARYYFREVLFAGMWPLTGFDSSQGRRRGAQKAAIKWLYFLWFAGVGGELYLRGLTGRPLRGIEWAPYSVVRTVTPAD
ncbi:hypothetical protein AV521_05145 [Streptomyces sp. IMTB 2501]|uniref:hypothetical protein n=1 Tax=Streptomyces sp. IMTB 2501 TaxID=1776340 RepID=UPI00096D52ED|nr:hypothetical protein [Streptomyces sp. IMTB 2501]OLZ73454.1 hypothetical protein AV521_05145 [Streptomyces sp. IMTB 2501]